MKRREKRSQGISRIETLHSELQNVERRLGESEDEDENKPNNST